MEERDQGKIGESWFNSRTAGITEDPICSNSIKGSRHHRLKSFRPYAFDPSQRHQPNQAYSDYQESGAFLRSRSLPPSPTFSSESGFYGLANPAPHLHSISAPSLRSWRPHSILAPSLCSGDITSFSFLSIRHLPLDPASQHYHKFTPAPLVLPTPYDELLP